MAAEGEFEVVKAGKNLGRLGVGKVFGELAILYNCKRTASVRAVCDARVWALERKVFQHIMVASGIKKIENQKNFLKSVPLLAELPQEMLTKMADVLETEQFLAGDYIIRQDTAGDTFYILAGGGGQGHKEGGGRGGGDHQGVGHRGLLRRAGATQDRPEDRQHHRPLQRGVSHPRQRVRPGFT